MKKAGIVVAAVAALALTSGAAWADADAALNKAGCMACHAKDKKLVGPSFKDIAAKYKGQDATAKLMEKVRKGGSGVYGPVPMPPNGADKISDGDLKDAIALILKTS
ncbi:c-type cytochrome [Hydrogenophaga sp. 5NK40-0174]|uniref:c-type cytochrome n=1 Tax=Hydrogenophaga sp. 5NK40-0174 TaxID=3127649 RepID=UPI003109E6D5